MKQAGFEDQEFVGMNDIKSSPVTTGALFRAKKMVQKKDNAMEDALNKYQDFLDANFADRALDRKTKYLMALAASLEAGFEPLIKHFVEVLRVQGATDEELKEAMAVAMTVGATKIKIIQENVLGSTDERKTAEIHVLSDKKTPADQTDSST